MAKAKKEKVEETTDSAAEVKATENDGKLKVKKKPSIKKMAVDNEPLKVDMSKVPAEEKQEEEQPKEEVNDKIVEEVKEEKVETKEEETEKPVLEEITEEKTDEVVEDKAETIEEAVEEAVEEAKETGKELPDNIQKVVDFMDETGGDLNDYVKLNQDYNKLDDKALLREYYNQTKSHLTSDEVDFLIEDRFDYDEEVDEVVDVKRKKLAFKEQVADAKSHLDGLKSKYYAEIKAGSKLNPEQKKAIDFFNRYNEKNEVEEKALEQQRSTFTQKTNNVFNDKFKGFEYNVGDKKFRFNVKDVNRVKEQQSDINNFVSNFLDKKSKLINNAEGYHKSMFTAMNADAVANHFYEQGKADGVKESIARSKNIDMSPRATNETDVSGVKVRAISGDSTDRLRFKIRK